MEVIKKHSLKDARAKEKMIQDMEQTITDLDIRSIESEIAMTDMDIRLIELESRVN